MYHNDENFKTPSITFLYGEQLQITMNVPSTQHIDSSGMLSNNFSLMNIKRAGSDHAGGLATCIFITPRHLDEVTGT